MNSPFSDYIVYVDESGDHGLNSIDSSYPIFVLVFCVFKKTDYVSTVVPLIQEFKLKHFGHDQVVLHETDIRRDRGSFAFLKSRQLKADFLNELTSIIQQSPFTLISSVIDKQRYRQKHQLAENPYHIGLRFGLERIFFCLRQQVSLTHIVVEQRGKVEDDELELEFRRICAGDNYLRKPLPFQLVFADKKSNSAGLQLADLVARPIGLHYLRPEQANRAFEIVNEKFYTNARGDKHGYGLKCYP
ncbi:3-deoxy-D-manno-octulosonic acid transferase [Methylomonas koyamae]|uniref:3-deoxy-D-manno-octulosonic acid transferase n=1 Tax=Methylomonas koyamae TaxID=702114 RepID=A0A177ND78_9GAMM|nr:DUF3800 domain-containing protein [Methylomonas koyamae]OAI15000.1 3-deoxy-D-manno-octulosonic acid transferase [Methylomonas koyamae]